MHTSFLGQRAWDKWVVYFVQDDKVLLKKCSDISYDLYLLELEPTVGNRQEIKVPLITEVYFLSYKISPDT